MKSFLFPSKIIRILLLVHFHVSCTLALPEDSSCRVEEHGVPSTPMPTAILSNGVKMPILSLGTAHYSFRLKHKDSNAPFAGFYPERTYRQIEQALQRGIRSFDTALMYGSQPQLGFVLGQWWASGKLQSRDDVFITTKVFHSPAPAFGLQRNQLDDLNSLSPAQVAEQVEQHIEQCLHELGVGYIDLLLMHWPSDEGQPVEISRQRRLAAWKVFETFYQRGWLRAIGVSNFSEKHLQDLMDDGATIRPMVNQIEASPYLQFTKIVEYCQQHNIQVQSYSPLGSGLNNVKDDPLLHELAAKHNKDVGQVALRYLVQKGYAVAYLTTSAERMVTNPQIFDFELDESDIKSIDGLNRADGSFGLPSPYDLP